MVLPLLKRLSLDHWVLLGSICCTSQLESGCIRGIELVKALAIVRLFFYQNIPVLKLKIQYMDPYKYRYVQEGYRGQLFCR